MSGGRWGLVALVMVVIGCASATGGSTHVASAEEQQTQWQPLYLKPPPLEGASFAFDEARGSAVLFGGSTESGLQDGTWTHENAHWTEHPVSPSPSARFHASMTYDPVRREVVLFGGSEIVDGASHMSDETWVWDGSSWSRRIPTVAPPARVQAMMGFDRARGVTVLTGGVGVSAALADTWEWDGVSWTQRQIRSPSCYDGTSAYDEGRRVMTVIGCLVNGAQDIHQYEFDGTQWIATSASTPDNLPLPRAAGMTFDRDRQRLVLFGGKQYTGTHTSDTWSFDGSGWSRVVSETAPEARLYPLMTWDATERRALLFGGHRLGHMRDDLWQNTASGGWQIAEPLAPPAVILAGATFDSSRDLMVLAGGWDGDKVRHEMWGFDGSAWRVIGTFPQATGADLISETGDGRILALVPALPTPTENDGTTWAWNGTSWSMIAPASASPPARAGAAMVYDRGRDVIVLFGGYTREGLVLGDTWEWSASEGWRVRATTGPAPRSSAAMAFDETRGRAVLFGGSMGNGAALDDTWEWDGSAWSQRATSGPNPRYGASAAFDAVRGRTVIFGGYGAREVGDPKYGDTWEWNGTSWTRTATTGPSARAYAVTVYDRVRHRTVLAGGSTSDTWFYGTAATPPPPLPPPPPPPPDGEADGGTTPTTTTVAAPPAPPASERSGYWMLEDNGTVHAFGDAAPLGNAPVGATRTVDIEATPTGNGYWIVDAAGHVFSFGDAPYLGGASPQRPGESFTSLTSTPTGRGYWLFTTTGRAVALGDASHVGDMFGTRLNAPVLDSVATPSGDGYYMVAADGGIFTFGDARFYGSMGQTRLNAPVRSLVPDPDGVGYWLVAADGGIFTFATTFRGSMGSTPLNRPISAMVGAATGYLMVGEDGGIFTFGDVAFHGSLGDHPPARPVVSVAPLSR